MRLYNRTNFMKLPPGVIYSKGKEWYFNNLLVKGNTVSVEGKDIDWYCLDVCWISSSGPEDTDYRLEDMLKNGTSYPMADFYGGDGYYDDEEIFLVFEKEDLKVLMGFIDKAMNLEAEAIEGSVNRLLIESESSIVV